MPKKASTFDKEAFEKEFNKRGKQFLELKNEATYTLEKKLDAAEIKYHSIPSRIKTLDSCLGKIEKHQFESPFEQMRDIVGLRVICLFLSDIPRIEDLVKRSFVVIDSDNKVEGGDNSSFGYMSVHHIARFGSKHKGERYDNIKNIPFEIQVRTIAMDAWANISHYLDYKTEQDIPGELKRDFHALSGMFYVADKHFQLFFEQRRKKREQIAETFEKKSDQQKFKQPINLDTLTAYLKTKFPHRNNDHENFISELVNQLTQAEYTHIGEIEEFILKGEDAFIEFEKAEGYKANFFTKVGAIRGILSIQDEKFLKVYTLPFATSNDFNERFAEAKKLWSPYKRFVKS